MLDTRFCHAGTNGWELRPHGEAVRVRFIERPRIVLVSVVFFNIGNLFWAGRGSSGAVDDHSRIAVISRRT
jgi:hypothetical protein